MLYSSSSSIAPTYFYMNNPAYATSGAIGVGSTAADTAALNNAATAMKALGYGVLLIPAGTYQISSFPSFAGTAGGGLTYAVRGMGSKITVLKSYATSLATSLTVNAPTSFITGAPEWGGFTIDGTNATGTAVGIAWGDVSYGAFQDVDIANFTLAPAFQFTNNNGWTEGMRFTSVRINNCLAAIDFNITATGYASFSYWNVESLYVNANANQSVIVDEASLGPVPMIHLGGFWRITANRQNGATTTGKMFWIKGFSSYSNVEWNINAEIDGGAAVNHTSFVIANGSAGINGFGTINFLGAFVAPTLSGGGYQIECVGNIYIPGLYTPASGFILAGGAVAQFPYNAPTAVTLVSGTEYVNTQNADLTLYVSISMSAAGTLKFVQQNYTISAAGPTVLTATVATEFMFTIKLHTNDHVRLDLASGSIVGTTTNWG